MATKKEYPISLIVRAVDKITGPLRSITAKLNELTKPFKSIGKGFRQFSEAAGFPAIKNGFVGVGNAVKNVGLEAFSLGAKLFAMASVAGFALYSIVRGAVDAGDKLAEMADRVGIGIDAYASLQYAAAQADVDQEAFNSSMDQFSKRLGEAKANGGPLLEFLNKVSPRLGQQVKNSHSAEEALSLMTDAFVRLDDPQKRAALSAAAFGKGSLQMGNFLHQGSAKLQAQQREYLRLAGSQEKFARGASDLDNGLRDLEVSFLGLRSAAAGALFPAFSKLSKAVTEFIVKNRDGVEKWAEGAATAIQGWLDGGGFERLIANIGDLLEVVKQIWETIGGFKGALVIVSTVMAGPLLSAIVGVIPAVYALGVALLTTPVGWFLLAVAAIAASVWLIYKKWEPIKIFFGMFFDSIAKVAQGLSMALAGIVTFNLQMVIDGWSRAVEGFRGEIVSLLGLIAMVPGGNGLVTALIGSGALDQVFAPATPGAGALGANRVLQSMPTQSTESNARVSVDFTNVPAGTRITADKSSSQPINLSAGYSMAGP